MIFVLDSSALIAVRRMSISDKLQIQCFDRLTLLKTQLRFPPQVTAELKQDNEALNKQRHDRPFAFVRATKPTCELSANLVTVTDLLADPFVSRVADPNTEKDEADMYILALAKDLRAKDRDVRVITQERRDSKLKLSMHSACAALGLIAMQMPAFLLWQGILAEDQINDWEANAAAPGRASPKR